MPFHPDRAPYSSDKSPPNTHLLLWNGMTFAALASDASSHSSICSTDLKFQGKEHLGLSDILLKRWDLELGPWGL